MFATHQDRLPKELAAHDITTMAEANRYLTEHYRTAFNEEFAVPAAEPGSAFVPFIGPGLADILCEHHERTVGRDNCVSFERKRLQIPAQAHRYHFVKARVRVHRYPDERLAVFHGPRKLAEYEWRWLPGGRRSRRGARAARPQRRGTVRVLWNCGRVPYGDRREPYGPCGQPVDNAGALPTACPHSRASRPQSHRTNDRSFKRTTGQFNLLPTFRNCQHSGTALELPHPRLDDLCIEFEQVLRKYVWERQPRFRFNGTAGLRSNVRTRHR